MTARFTRPGSVPADECADIEELKRLVDSHEATLRLAKWILGFLIATVMGSVITVATKIYSWGYSSATIERRVEYIEKEVERLNRAFYRINDKKETP